MIGIYAGEGASHSWTWFVTVMEGLGSSGYAFIDGEDLRRGDLSSLRAVLIGGGDVEGMARELGAEGARSLDAFVRAGGVYLGSCAGAYLVMREVDLPPYTPFAFIDAGMANYLDDPPQPLRLPHKYKVAYGAGAVFHPAYGPVRVSMGEGTFLEGLGEISAALYGGPVILPGKGCECLAEYRGLDAGCLPLVGEPLLSAMMEGTCAAARQGYGEGHVYICGPHFECPYSPQGAEVLARVLEEENIYIMSDIIGPDAAATVAGAGPEARRLLKRVKSELSNVRIAARGLEALPVRWALGTKVWEPEKVIYYAEFLWERVPRLEERAGGPAMETALVELADLAADARERVRALKRALDDGEETTRQAEELFRRLRCLTIRFLEAVRGEAAE